jgi:predicted negative regulator of RcsB-dependent stress response
VKETKGDVLVARGDASAARDAYESALEHEALPGAVRERIDLKLEGLGPAGG